MQTMPAKYLHRTASVTMMMSDADDDHSDDDASVAAGRAAARPGWSTAVRCIWIRHQPPGKHWRFPFRLSTDVAEIPKRVVRADRQRGMALHFTVPHDQWSFVSFVGRLYVICGDYYRDL